MDIGIYIAAVLAVAPSQPAQTINTVPWWGPLLLQTLGSLAGVWAGASLVGRRERATRERRRLADIAYLAVTVSGLLEKFVSDCADLASDDGTSHGQVGPNGREAQYEPPTLNYSDLDVEWMALPASLLDQLHSLPLKLDSARRYLAFHSSVLHEEDYFDDRQLKYAELGLKAAEVSRTLREFGSLPPVIDSSNDTAAWLEEAHSKLMSRKKAAEEEQARTMTMLAGMAPDRERPT